MMTRADPPTGPRDPLHAASLGRLSAAGLPAAWAGRERFIVLELGFDGGAALLAAHRSWRDDLARCTTLHWAAWLPAPLARDSLRARLAALHAPRDTCDALVAGWPIPVPGIHRVVLDGGRCVLTLAVGDPRRLLPGWLPRADALVIGLDPGGTPIDAATFRTGASLLGDGARVGLEALDREPLGIDPRRALDPALAALRAAGLHLEPAGGRGAWTGHRVRGRGAHDDARGTVRDRAVLVVGGGLAGTAAAAALARRGLAVTRLDGRPPRGSSQPVLAQHPSLTPDDAPLSRLTRSATLLSGSDPVLAGVLRRHGRVQLADPARAHAVCAAWPRDWAEPVDAAEASRRAGVALRRGGWWLPLAGSADPDALRDAWTVAGVEVVTDVTIAVVARDGDGWAALDDDGRVVARAPVVLLAPGAHGLALRVDGDLPARPLDDQLGPAGLRRRTGLTTVATLPADAVPRCTVGGDGHAVPVDATRLLLGPPGTPDDDDDPLDPDDTRARAWRRWTDALAIAAPAPSLAEGRRGARLSTRDHLPVVGPVPDLAAIDARRRRGVAHDDRMPIPVLDGLWIAGAFGGRGLLWSVLAAELLAARLVGEPAPLERELARRLEPDRFLRHALRRADTSG